MYMFNGGVQLMEMADESFVLSGPKPLRFRNLSEQDRNILLQLVDGVPDCDPVAQSSLMTELVKGAYVAHYGLDYSPNARFSRQVDYLSAQTTHMFELQQSLSEKKVLIIGCGGTGSMVAQALLGHGFKKFVLVDDDVVQNSNFNRQLFFRESDLGIPKVDALKISILNLQSQATVESEQRRIHSTADLDKLIERYCPDFIIGGADYPPILIQKWTTIASQKWKVPVIFGGVGIENSSVGPLLHSEEGKVNYLAWIEKKLKMVRPESLRPVRGSLASTNLACSSFVAFEIFKYFTARENCLALDARLIFDFKTYSVSKKESFDESPQ